MRIPPTMNVAIIIKATNPLKNDFQSHFIIFIYNGDPMKKLARFFGNKTHNCSPNGEKGDFGTMMIKILISLEFWGQRAVIPSRGSSGCPRGDGKNHESSSHRSLVAF